MPRKKEIVSCIPAAPMSENRARILMEYLAKCWAAHQGIKAEKVIVYKNNPDGTRTRVSA